MNIIRLKLAGNEVNGRVCMEIFRLWRVVGSGEDERRMMRFQGRDRKEPGKE